MEKTTSAGPFPDRLRPCRSGIFPATQTPATENDIINAPADLTSEHGFYKAFQLIRIQIRTLEHVFVRELNNDRFPFVNLTLH
jgi:hypothetical protein